VLWPDGFRGGVAGQLREGRVDPDDCPLAVGESDAAGGGLQGRALEAEAFLVLLALGDVREDRGKLAAFGLKAATSKCLSAARK